MKSLKKLLFLSVIVGSMVVSSCKKDNKNETTITDTTATIKIYQKRWDINNVEPVHRPIQVHRGLLSISSDRIQHRPQGPGNYAAIEFMLNSYVIFFVDGTLKVGQYTASTDSTLVLDSLGTLKITSLQPASFSFILIPSDGSTSLSFNSVPAPVIDPVSTPADSAFFSNTWALDSTIDFNTGELDTFEISNGTKIYGLFSQYGTYLVRQVTKEGFEEYDANTWLWSNEEHNQICYGNWDGKNVTDCNGLNSISISLYDDYTHLIIQEISTGLTLKYYLHKL